MSITFPLTMPTAPRPSKVRVMPYDIAGVTGSPFTARQQIHDWGQGFWQLAVDLPRMGIAAGSEWAAFLLSLRGPVGTFMMGDPSKEIARGVATGTPLVDGIVLARATSLPTKGWTTSQVGILKAYDHIQIGTRLHAVLKDVDSDGAGEAVLDIWPPVRAPIADLTAIVVSSPKGIWRLSGPAREWEVTPPLEYGHSFQAIEDLTP